MQPSTSLHALIHSLTQAEKRYLRVYAGRHVDRVTIRNDGIQAHGTGREFDQKRVAMTYGMTLCVDTRVNFKGNHKEEGDLYEAMDDDGQDADRLQQHDVFGKILRQRGIAHGMAAIFDDEDLPRIALQIGQRFDERFRLGDHYGVGGVTHGASIGGQAR